jgi:hypothetical protein
LTGGFLKFSHYFSEKKSSEELYKLKFGHMEKLIRGFVKVVCTLGPLKIAAFNTRYFDNV